MFLLFGFRAHALKTIARTTPLVKAVLPKRDFAVCVLLDSKVKTATKVNPNIIWLIKTNRTIQSRVKKKRSSFRVYPLSGSHPETLHEKANSRPCLLFPEIKSVFVKQTKAMLDDYLFDRMMKNIEYVIDN